MTEISIHKHSSCGIYIQTKYFNFIMDDVNLRNPIHFKRGYGIDDVPYTVQLVNINS